MRGLENRDDMYVQVAFAFAFRNTRGFDMNLSSSIHLTGYYYMLRPRQVGPTAAKPLRRTGQTGSPGRPAARTVVVDAAAAVIGVRHRDLVHPFCSITSSFGTAVPPGWQTAYAEIATPKRSRCVDTARSSYSETALSPPMATFLTTTGGVTAPGFSVPAHRDVPCRQRVPTGAHIKDIGCGVAAGFTASAQSPLHQAMAGNRILNT